MRSSNNCAAIAALHESGSGTSRQFAAAHQFGRYQSEADIERANPLIVDAFRKRRRPAA